MAGAPPATVYLEHWMPGRARLRVPRPRTAAQFHRVARQARKSRSVRSVDANPATGSLLVTFGSDDPLDLIIDELRLAGLKVLSVAEPAGTAIRTQSSGAAAIRHVLSQANSRLHVTTRGRLDLRLAVPAIYMLLSARALVRQRGRLRDATWYQLAYWAFDSFFKLHEETTTLQGGPGAGGRITK